MSKISPKKVEVSIDVIACMMDYTMRLYIYIQPMIGSPPSSVIFRNFFVFVD